MTARLGILAVLVCVVVVAVLTIQGNSDGMFIALAFIVGVCVGVAWDDAWDLIRSARKDRTVAHEGETATETTARHRFNGISALGIGLIGIAAALMVVGVLLIIGKNATESYSRCTAEWQQQFGEAYVARVTASTEVSEAMDDIVQSVADDDKAAFDAAVQHYVKVREDQKQKQAENPLPPLPEALCGER